MNESSNTGTVLDTELLWTTVEEKLKSAFNILDRFEKNKNVELIGAGQTFMSIVGRYYPNCTGSHPELPTSLILKIPFIGVAVDCFEDSNGSNALQAEGCSKDELRIRYSAHAKLCHDVEVSVYQFINKTKLHAKIPNSYVLETTEHSGTQAFLALENIQDAFVVPITQYLSISECLQVIEEIAKIHAHSLSHQCWDYINGIAFKEFLRTGVTKDHKKVMLSLAKMVEELDPDRLKPLTEKLDGVFNKFFDWEYVMKLNEKLEIPPVLVHGDLWPANVLWRQENGKRTLAAIVDWQLSHPGCGGEDLQRWICSSLNPDVRRANSRNLLHEYYKFLQKYLKRNPPFTLQQVEESFVRIMPFAAINLLPTFGPLILRQMKKNTPEEVEEARVILVDKAVSVLEDCFNCINAIENNNIVLLQ